MRLARSFQSGPVMFHVKHSCEERRFGAESLVLLKNSGQVPVGAPGNQTDALLTAVHFSDTLFTSGIGTGNIDVRIFEI